MAISLAHKPDPPPGRGAQERHCCPICVPDGKSQVTVEYDGRQPGRAWTRSSSRPSTRRTWITRPDRARHHRARRQGRDLPAEHAGREHEVSTSTPPAASSSAARRATPASPDARSSWTPTAATAATAAARSPARTRPRWTAPRPTRPVTWRKNLVAAGLARQVRDRAGLCHRRGAAGLHRWWTPSAPACWPTNELAQLVGEVLRPAPRRHHRRAWTCAAPSTRRPRSLRPLRPPRPRPALGKDRLCGQGQGRRGKAQVTLGRTFERRLF